MRPIHRTILLLGLAAIVTSPIACTSKQSAADYNHEGVVKVVKGDYEGGIEDFNKAIRRDPNYVNAYLNRGNARAEQKNYQAAIADYTQAIRINPRLAIAYHNRGNIRTQRHDYRSAIADYTEALLLNPKDVIPACTLIYRSDLVTLRKQCPDIESIQSANNLQR